MNNPHRGSYRESPIKMGLLKTSSLDVDDHMGVQYSTYSVEEGYALASVTSSDGELMETLGSIPNSTQDPDVRHRTRLRSDESTSESSSPIDHASGEGNPEYVFQDEYDNGFSVDTPVCYQASAAFTNQVAGLIDSGANGGLANPKEMKLISYASPGRFVNITGVGNMKIPRLRIGTFAAKVQTQDGRYIILMFHEYGELPDGKTIHSKIQLRDNGCAVYDEPESLDGKQCLITLEGHNIPIDFENGLAYIKMTYPDEEDLKLPTIIMTRDVPWDPKRYDQAKSPHVGDGTNPDVVNTQVHHGFDQYGDYIHTSSYGEHIPEEGTAYGDLFHAAMSVNHRVPSTGEILPEPSDPIHCAWDLGFNPTYTTDIYAHHALIGDINVDYAAQRINPVEYQECRKFFLNVPTNRVRSTFEATTRHYRFIPSTNKFMTYKSPYPANNVFRRHEIVFTDTVYSDVPAWGGIHAAQVFAGKMSRYISVHGCKTDKDFPRCLEDEIRKRGAMDKLGSDRAKAEISKKVHDILRTLFIDDWQSEPYFQHQNFAERMIGELKKFTNWVLNWSDAPDKSWFLAFEYVTFIMNRTANETLNWRTPVEALTGQTPDISMLLHFTFWEPVFIGNYRGSGVRGAKKGKGFPSKSDEILVRFVGYSEDVGHSCTFKVWNEETEELLYRSSLRKVDPDTDVLNVPPYDPQPVPDMDDELIEEVVKNREPDPSIRRTAMFEPEELVGRSFLLKHNEDGTRDRATVLDYEYVDGATGEVDPLDKYYDGLEKESRRINFKVKVGGTGLEKFIEWSDMCEFVEEQIQNEDTTWNFRKIVGHKRNLQSREKPQILVLWESGEITYEPIDEFYKDEPHLLAEYALKKGVLKEWEKKCPKLKLTQMAKNTKTMLRRINQAKRRSFKNTPIYMFGVKVPRNHEQAVQFDKENGNTLWQDSERTEINQMFEYNVFEDRGHRSTAKAPDGYKKIPLHMVYACKHDGRRKSRLVAGGHLTDTPLESVYSGVVSLRGIRIIVFLAELNDLEVYQTDIGNAYLEAKTQEKVYCIAGGEFGERKDHLFVIIGSLYGLKSSAKRFHEVLHDVLRDMGFSPCPAEPDIWMRAMNPDDTPVTPEQLKSEDPAFTYPGVQRAIFDGYYEYIATYVDDLTIGSKKPQVILDYLQEQAKFKLKGSDRIHYLLGCDYWRDDEGVLCSAPKKYIRKMEDTYERLFGEKPKHCKTPLEPNSHPELDTTEFCNEEETKIYQSLVGASQWATSLGRFDICVHVMTLSSFRAAPRKGHLEMIKRFYGYLSKMSEATIRYRTDMPDLEDLDFQEYDWSRTVYADAYEEYPANLPVARGKPVQQLTYVDANLYHDMLSGKSVTALLHLLNQTPIDWYSKKQSTVETATFGSENVAARTAIEQMRTIKFTLLYLGVPVVDRSILVGDNKSVVDCATQPHSRLSKRHLMLSYHYVREAIASGNYAYVWIHGKLNPADILSKHWAWKDVWPFLQPLLYWQGDTNDCPIRLMSGIEA